MAAYYNEHDRAKAAWLREAIVQGVIAYGEVDERSIEDVAPADLEGFTQCHFFAGIGGWSIALRLAGYGNAVHPRPNGGHWRAADWLFCRDGFWRPAEPGTFPLAYGLPRSIGRLQPELQRLAEMAGLDAKSLARAKNNRIVRLQGYGDAINVIQAAEFVRAYMEERALPLLAGEGM